MTYLSFPQRIKEVSQDFFDLFFPQSCTACQAPLLGGEKLVCTPCRGTLPRTNFHLLKQSPLEKIFWGRIPVEGIWAYLRYTKGGKVQSMLHALKYRGNQSLGILLGQWFGHELKRAQCLPHFDCIIPVPLHPERLSTRGYNQSERIAEGLSKTLNIPYRTDLLIRVRSTSTQTKKSRYHRWENVSTVFQTPKPELLQSLRILLVDDVITTGATLEAASQPILQANASVGIACIAYAR